MKPKNFSKKLNLNKKTIANLSTGEMKFLNGGGTGESVDFCIVTPTCGGATLCPTITGNPQSDPCCNTC